VQNCSDSCLWHEVDLVGSGAAAGSIARVRLRETNLPGLSTDSNWTYVTIDDTPPAVPDVAPLACTDAGHASPTTCADAPDASHACTSARMGTSDVLWWQPTNRFVKFCWSAPGFADAESTVRALTWKLYQLNRSNVTQRTFKCQRELSTEDSRTAVQHTELLADLLLCDRDLIENNIRCHPYFKAGDLPSYSWIQIMLPFLQRKLM
jgi:hypothetical protein